MNEEALIEKSVSALKKGDLLIYPTETVYGIGVDSQNIEGIKKLYKIKNRAIHKPLVLNVSSIDMVSKLAYISEDTRLLMEYFCPGPITFIFKSISEEKNIGFRMPDNSLTLKVIENSGAPISGTSANISGLLASTNIEKTKNYFPQTDIFFLDGGKPRIGIESTILDMSACENYKIIRHGIIAKEKIESIIKKTISDEQSEIYYSVEGNIKFLLTTTSQLEENKYHYTKEDHIWLVRESTAKKLKLLKLKNVIILSDDSQEALKNLYDIIHSIQSNRVKIIVAEKREPISYADKLFNEKISMLAHRT
ncbi:L-threonylcarbamoyladenylate synthase [Lysinibacillus sp. NPDC097195]|uniref:L-threonylcarbamoyladenylate synthase n=1 Tax=Lysinibacillus sp. NPDC097195 TaxID=3364141 RepID=UPI00381814A5